MEIFHNGEAAMSPSTLRSGPEDIGRMVLDTAQLGVPEEPADGRRSPFGLPLMVGVRLDAEASPSAWLANRAQTSTITNLDGKNDEKFIDDSK